MRCRVEYEVAGNLRLAESLSIRLPDRIYELRKVADDRLASIVVDLAVTDEEDWPTFSTGAESKLYTGGRSFLPKLRAEMQVLESLLSLFGIKGIDVNTLRMEWIPETEEEKNKLQLYSFEFSTERSAPPPIDNTELGLMIQFVLASRRANEIEIPLSFYRKGVIAFWSRNNFEAIFSWYFMLETLFGNGKWRKAEVTKAFESSPELMASIEHSLKNPGGLISRDPSVLLRFTDSFKTWTPSKYINYLVDLRGFLHHHSAKNPMAWDPDDPYPFELDALLLQNITSRIAIRIVWPYATSTETEHEFQQAKVTVLKKVKK